MSSTRIWAERCFGAAELRDQRLTAWLVTMAQRAAVLPAPHVTSVFRSNATRQAAYDFLEHSHIPHAAVGEALFRSTARACAREDRVLIPLDGTSLSLSDHRREKDFGTIGTFTDGGRGLKVMNALALTWQGVPIGVVDQQWWTRNQPVNRRSYRPRHERESVRWNDAATRIGARFAELAPNTRLHFLVDREGDTAHLIRGLVAAGHEFTIRANATKPTRVAMRNCRLLSVLAARPIAARTTVEVPARSTRPARLASLEIRVARMPIRFRDKYQNWGKWLDITVVWARETSRAPKHRRIDWVLYTNVDVRTGTEAREALERYASRWRIEDFHRAWKGGLCRVEETQLRSMNAVIKWATILAAVASRAEHLKRRCREKPDVPATDEFTADEIEAIVLLKNEARSSRAKPMTADGLTLATAVRWIADLGGYVGNRNSGPPGATTIGRGLDPVLFTAVRRQQERTRKRH
jgi:hypothetical protein